MVGLASLLIILRLVFVVGSDFPFFSLSLSVLLGLVIAHRGGFRLRKNWGGMTDGAFFLWCCVVVVEVSFIYYAVFLAFWGF